MEKDSGRICQISSDASRDRSCPSEQPLRREAVDVEAGLYITFFTEGESFESELPPVGPLDHLVMRDRALIADRGDVQHVDHFGGGSRWIEAELELQRALGNESGGGRRAAMRIGVPQGGCLR